MLLATALACCTGCAQQTFAVQTGSSSYKAIPIISSFWNWAEKTVDAIKFVAAQKMLLKQKPSKHS